MGERLLVVVGRGVTRLQHEEAPVRSDVVIGEGAQNVTNLANFTPSSKQVSYLTKYLEELELPRQNVSNNHSGLASKVPVRTIWNWLNKTEPGYVAFREWFAGKLQTGIDIKRLSATYRAAILAEQGSVAHLRTIWSDEVTGRVTGGIQGPEGVSIKIMLRIGPHDTEVVKGGPKLDHGGGGKLDHPVAGWRV